MLENELMYLYQTFQFSVINTSTTYTKSNSSIKMAFIAYKIHFHFAMRKSLNILSFTPCNSMIASNKTKTKAQYFSHNPKSKPQGSP